MKSIIMFALCSVFALPMIMFPPGASAAPSQESGPVIQQSAVKFTDVERKEWFLSEVRSAVKTVRMDRSKLGADNMGGVYTVNFQDDRVSGMGAPNRYFGPYTVGSNMALSIGNLASTMMMAFKDPDGLKEGEYFTYLSKVTRWDLREGRLELYSSNSDGSEAILVFDLK